MRAHRGLVWLSVGALLLVPMLVLAQAGDGFILNGRATGGGRASQGGTYVLVGAIGQADAGEMAGGAYTLGGGLWGGGALVGPTPGVPTSTPTPTTTPGVPTSTPTPTTTPGVPTSTTTPTPGTPTPTPTVTPPIPDTGDAVIYIPLVLR